MGEIPYCEFCGYVDHSTPACKEPVVLVSIKGLKLLYECAKSFDTRIPGNGSGWAEPFRQIVEADDTAEGSG